MRILLKWFMTGNISPLEEEDALLGPQTTIWEVKGLVQGHYTYAATNLILIHNRTLLENHETLADCAGIVDHATAESNVLTIHMLSDEELEGDDIDDPSQTTDTAIHEYKHEDFAKVAAMLGREVPVAPKRVAQVRQEAPRARPAFLNKPTTASYDGTALAPPAHHDDEHEQQHHHAEAGAAAAAAPEAEEPADVPPPPPDASQPRSAIEIFRTGYHGLRREGVDKDLQLAYPGVAEPFTFWDCRPCEVEGRAANPEDVRLDLFFFGEIKGVDSHRFAAMAVELLKQRGYKVSISGSIREAGCMYPLIAVPVSLPDAEAQQLGNYVFEHFGKPVQPVRAQAAGPAAGGGGGGAGGKPPPCVIQ